MFAIIIAVLAAFISGFVDAIAGGGGIITFPVLLYLDMPVSLIVGTNKLAATFGTGMAFLTFYRHRRINPELVLPALPFTCIGALAGAWLVTILPNEFLKPFISTALFILAVYFFFRSRPAVRSERVFGRILVAAVCTAALLIGFYDGFFGPGTGMFLTFVFVRIAGLDYIRSTGNTKVLNFGSNMMALLYFIWQGNVSYALGVPMAFAGLAGGWLGAKCAIRVGEGLVRWIFVIMALALAFKMAADYLK